MTTQELLDAPELDSWEPFNISEVDRIEDFARAAEARKKVNSDGWGIICPLPVSIALDEASIDSYYRAIQSDPDFKTKTSEQMESYGILSAYIHPQGQQRQLQKSCLPKPLIDMGLLLKTAFDMAAPSTSIGHVGFWINSQFHRQPYRHIIPVTIANVDGATTIMCKRDEPDEPVTGKKSLPPQSICFFNHIWHAVPDTDEPRLCVICN